jgi:hypothetical protein
MLDVAAANGLECHTFEDVMGLPPELPPDEL